MRKPRGMVPSTCGSIEQFYRNVDTVGAGDNFKTRIDVLELEEALALSCAFSKRAGAARSTSRTFFCC